MQRNTLCGDCRFVTSHRYIVPGMLKWELTSNSKYWETCKGMFRGTLQLDSPSVNTTTSTMHLPRAWTLCCIVQMMTSPTSFIPFVSFSSYISIFLLCFSAIPLNHFAHIRATFQTMLKYSSPSQVAFTDIPVPHLQLLLSHSQSFDTHTGRKVMTLA